MPQQTPVSAKSTEGVYRKTSRAELQSDADAFAREQLNLQSRTEAFRELEQGKWNGTLVADELRMFRFLLGE